MPSSTPDWSALASQNEKVIDGQAAEPTTSVPAPAASQRSGQPGRHRSPERKPLWRGRAARVAAASTVGVLAMSGVAAGTAAAATPATSWRFVKHVSEGSNGQFTAVTAFSRSGGWAFDGQFGVTAWKRSGGGWSKVSFPDGHGASVVAAGATSASDAWAFVNGSKFRAMHWNGHHWTSAHSFSTMITGAVVLGSRDVWVFGQSFTPGKSPVWHFNGSSWKRVSSGNGLNGGSGLSASNVWAYGGAKVAHWNGHSWKKTSVSKLLPAKNKEGVNDPAVVAMYAQSSHSVWAVGDGNDEDEGGSLVVLHYNGHSWKRVASSSVGGYSNFGSVAPDGHGGLWIPLSTSSGGVEAHFMHYTGGRIKTESLPVPASNIEIQAVATIPDSGGQALAVGFTHSSSGGGLGSDVVGAILQYGG